MNINDPLDFALLTQQQIGEIENLFTIFQRERTKWNIQEGIYRPAPLPGTSPAAAKLSEVKFLTFTAVEGPNGGYRASTARINDSGGRRKKQNEFLYVDGQFLDDHGRKGQAFEIEVMFHGTGYKNGMTRFLTALDKPTPGTLLHPVRGEITCGLDTYAMVHENSASNACMINVRLLEHRSAANFGLGVYNTNSSVLAKAIGALKNIALAIQAVRGLVRQVTGIVKMIIEKMQAFEQFFRAFLVECNAAFNTSGYAALASILPVSVGGNAVASRPLNVLGSSSATANLNTTATVAGGYVLSDEKFRTVVSTNDPLSSIPRELLSDTGRQALAINDLQKRATTLSAYAGEILADIEGSVIAVDASDQALVLRESINAANEVLQQGLKSNSTAIRSFTTPRVMSIREVAFANGLTPDQSQDIDILNPELLSLNYIEKGTVVLVPVTL